VDAHVPQCPALGRLRQAGQWGVPAGLGNRLTHGYKVGRCAAYIKGWCLAFGEHATFTDDASGISWLYQRKQGRVHSASKAEESAVS
jgi:hypothetical protein